MALPDEVLDVIRVEPGKKAKLHERDPAWKADPLFRKQDGNRKEVARERLLENVKAMAAAQELLYADDRYGLLVVFQAMDAAGKDGTIKHVMSGVNPQGVQVYSFKQPSMAELDHNFLWRYWQSMPERGRIGIFNRSYYEEVLVQRVHPAWLDRQRLPPGKRGDDFWQGRFEDINAMERHLDRNGIKVLKFFLHVSEAEQKRRFLSRLDEESKHWKFSAADMVERGFWDDYQHAYEAALTATSTPWAPWYVIPADRKAVMRLLVSTVLTSTIKDLGLRMPTLTDTQMADLEKARRQLTAE